MQNSSAKILNYNEDACSIVASAARMSTQQGTALDIYARSGDPEKDLKLIGKVLSSGHKSVIEHQTFSIALNDVSVLVEQFVIEFRLASFTVKSRRYVDFSEAGYVVPSGLSVEGEKQYRGDMNALFQDYQQLLSIGIPKEDARFLLPYCLRSNFFMTLDARELIHMICSMTHGRGARFEELRQLGASLKAQFEQAYPGVIDAEEARYAGTAEETLPDVIQDAAEYVGSAQIIGAPADAESLLETAMAFAGRFQAKGGRDLCPENMRALLNDPRPRELEALNYTFRISDISLACLTHFTRHRIQSPVIPSVLRALAGGHYVMPQSVRENADAAIIYRQAFARQAVAARRMQEMGVPAEILAYYAMSGHQLDFLMTLNARELLHFAKLRTCTRAQWEIRQVARKMLQELNAQSPSIFSGFGPSCAVTGRCPEGKMTCGNPVEIVDGIWRRAHPEQE